MVITVAPNNQPAHRVLKCCKEISQLHTQCASKWIFTKCREHLVAETTIVNESQGCEIRQRSIDDGDATGELTRKVEAQHDIGQAAVAPTTLAENGREPRPPS